MNKNFTRLQLLFASLLISTGLFAQLPPSPVVGDFASLGPLGAGGTFAWGNTASWQFWNGTAWQTPALHIPDITTDPTLRITIQSGDVILVDASHTISTIDIESGGTLQINNFPTTTNDVLTINQGSASTDLTVETGGALVLGGFDTFLKGTGNPNAVINGTMNWTSGTLGVATTISNGATLNLSNDIDKNITATFINNGTMNWSTFNIIPPTNGGGGIFPDPLVTVTNGPTGVINEFFDQDHGFGGGSAAFFINQGVINKHTATEFRITSTFTNTGTIQGTVSGAPGNSGTIGITDVGGLVDPASGGTVAPGNGTTASRLTIDPLLFNNGSAALPTTLSITIVSNGSIAGTNYDQAISTGSGPIDITAATLKVVDNGTDPVGTVYTVMTSSAGYTGTNFATLNLAPTIGTVNVGPTDITVQKITPLPLTWGPFNALALSDNSVSLTWSTYQEENVSRFVVEYSSDGSNYQSIGTVAAVGNSTAPSSYKFIHTKPSLNGTDFYRLQEVDLDGKATYSSVRALKFNNGQIAKVLATPNPVHDLLQLNVQAEGISAILVDGAGRALHTWILQKGSQEMNVNDLPAGHYQLVIYQKDQRIDIQHILKF
jgi:hypothetical protein